MRRRPLHAQNRFGLQGLIHCLANRTEELISPFSWRKRRITSVSSFCLTFALALSAFVAPSSAGVIVAGPYPDFAGLLTVTTSVTIPTAGAFVVPIPLDGFLVFGFKDRVTVAVTATVPVFVPTFVGVGIVGDPTFDPNVQLTDILAVNAGGTLGGPDGNVPLLTGFNTANPQVVPMGSEEFIGNSGTVYSGPITATTVANLSSLLPGADLSQFAGADPTSTVYVSQATAPLTDVTVPEPASIALLGSGLIALMVILRKRRRAALDIRSPRCWST
jgi:hypothetical protein